MKNNTVFLKCLMGVSIFAILFTSCKSERNESDASGYFEAIETLVSSQANGTLIAFDVQEGQQVAANVQVGQVDSTQIYLSLQQVQAQRGAVLSRKPDINSQTAIIKEQLVQANRELKRIENLFAGKAATQKQVDDARSAVAILTKQLDAQQSILAINSNTVGLESTPLEVQTALLRDQLQKCRIINPVAGTVLVTYVEPHEMVTMGKPLYKVADLSTITLRAYITNSQLTSIKLNQKVKVKIDKGYKQMVEYEGIVSWISAKAEFTPKTIQTKEERSNEVYAVKISVKNDGFIKIGMYGEVVF